MPLMQGEEVVPGSTSLADEFEGEGVAGSAVATVGGATLCGPGAARACAAVVGLPPFGRGVLSGCHCCKSY